MDYSKYNQPSPDIHEGVPKKIKGELLDAKLAVMNKTPWLSDNGEVLDVGPACGWETIDLINRYDCRVTALTLFEEEADVLRKIDGVNVVVSDMHDMDDGWNDKYEFVFASHVLEHSHSPYIALSEFYRVLRNGGTCFIVLPNADGYTGLNRERPTRIGDMKAHLFMPSIDTMIEMAKHVGFCFDSYHEVPQMCQGLVHYINRIFIFKKGK